MAKKKTRKSKPIQKKARNGNLLGSWSFLVGLILAVILGLGLGGSYQATLLWVVFLLQE